MDNKTINSILTRKVDSLLKKMQAKNKFTDLTTDTALTDGKFLNFYCKWVILESMSPPKDAPVPTGTSTKAKALKASITSGRGKTQYDRILAHLEQVPNRTREEICEALNILNQSACGVIAKLKEDGKIFVSGTKQSSTDIEVETYSTYTRHFKK